MDESPQITFLSLLLLACLQENVVDEAGQIKEREKYESMNADAHADTTSLWPVCVCYRIQGPDTVSPPTAPIIER